MNVYDFDNTIYDGESTFDFFLCCIKHDKRFLKLLPLLVRKLIKYKLCLISNEELIFYAEKYAAEFFKYMPDLDDVVCEFWDKNIHKIKPYYAGTRRDDDVVISASCDFLLLEAAKRLGIKNLICSTIDRKTGKVGEMCFRANKPTLFKKHFPDAKIDTFYTDSMNDKPLIDLAETAYLVKGNKLKKVK